jgi:hypothetical protein
MRVRFLRFVGAASTTAFVIAAAIPAGGQAPASSTAKPAGSQSAPAPPPPSAAKPAAKPTPSTWKAPRTPWGHPDLQGIYSNSTIVPLERPANMKDKAELSDEEVKKRFDEHRGRLFNPKTGGTGFYNEFWWEWGKDANRTSMVIDPPDGKIPWSPQAQERMKSSMKRFGGLPGTWVDLNILDRCITRSMPGTMMPGFYNHYYHILQTPTHVAIKMELLNDTRIIPIDNMPHVGQNIRQWLGDARGHWEGDTLVVETTNMTDKLDTQTSATYFSVASDMKMTERFRRVDPDTIDYTFTIESPSSFSRPWTAAIPLWKTTDQMFEYACHEGNYAMPNSLSGARYEEAERAKKAAEGKK